MELLGYVQRYHWGKQGSTSLVAQFALNNYKEFERRCSGGGCPTAIQLQMDKGVYKFEINEDEKYAEFWMGAHPSGPCLIKTYEGSIPRPKLLSKYLHEAPAVLNSIAQKDTPESDRKLPFLFKVLSVQMALSIQAHPDKPSAEKLHVSHPELYKDPNHKPEMAVAITDFEVLCGFRSFDQILYFLEHVHELVEILTKELIEEFKAMKNKEALKKVYSKLMNTPQEIITEKLEKLLRRFNHFKLEDQVKYEVDLVQRLSAQFPNDIGIFCIFFLQHFTLSPGQAIFLPANEPHAYIHGDCVEIMAESDNVVRAGLTPKFKDVKTLCEMLTYETGRDWILNVKRIDLGGNCFKTEYNPPDYITEFALTRYELNANESSITIEPLAASPSILLCVQGNGLTLNKDGKEIGLAPGSCLFLPAAQKESESELYFQMNITSNCDKLVIFQAYARN